MSQTFGTITIFLEMVTNFGILHQTAQLLTKVQILFIKPQPFYLSCISRRP